MNWKNIKYFKSSEFDSKDSVGSGEHMKIDFVSMLDDARENAGVPFKLTSGFRTPAYNKKVGGTENSSHMKYCAVDISAKTSTQRFLIIEACINAGFSRIGIGKNFIHVDNDKSKSKEVAWLY